MEGISQAPQRHPVEPLMLGCSPPFPDVFLWQVHLSPKREETKEGGVSARSGPWPRPHLFRVLTTRSALTAQEAITRKHRGLERVMGLTGRCEGVHQAPSLLIKA